MRILINAICYIAMVEIMEISVPSLILQELQESLKLICIYSYREHRHRKMLKVEGALKKLRAKNFGHAHFSLKPHPFCIYDALSKSLLVEATKK